MFQKDSIHRTPSETKVSLGQATASPLNTSPKGPNPAESEPLLSEPVLSNAAVASNAMVPDEAYSFRNRTGSLLQSCYDPRYWQQRQGLTALMMRTFFQVFDRARSAGVIASAASFSTRIAAAALVSQLTNSKLLLGAAIYLSGVLVHWPICYTLLRLQDRQAATDAQGKLDRKKLQELRPHSLAFLPAQEAGYALCFLASSTVVMSASQYWPWLFGAAGGAMISVSAFGLHYLVYNHYGKLALKSGSAASRVLRRLFAPKP